MRHKYAVQALVLSRTPVGEASELLALLTDEVGLVRARAQGTRSRGAKLAPALVTFAESSVVLVRGKDGWRVAGAVLSESWFSRFGSSDARGRAARVAALALRLVPGEAPDRALLPIILAYFGELAEGAPENRDAAEILTALMVLSVLGLDRGEPESATELFAPEKLAQVAQSRAAYVARVNRGIAASGL